MRAVVVIPAYDEEETDRRVPVALAAQDGLDPDEYQVVLVHPGCTDDTGGAALAAAAAGTDLRLLTPRRPRRRRGRGAARGHGPGLQPRWPRAG